MLTVTKDNFDEKVLQADGDILVDFWASWCGPCRMLAPVLDEIDQESHTGLTICKLNVDDEPELAQKFAVMTIPTLILFRNGEVADQSVGVIPKAKILEFVGK